MAQTAPTPRDPSPQSNPLERLRATPARGVADIVLAVLVMAIVAIMVLPLPTALLDVFLALNLSLSVLLLLVALYVPDALAIASFPTVLLVTTLYRLALDVAATRLILGKGDGGEVIRAFGQFVVRGNYVVGGVMFVILTLVQFLVIARGSERVAEVAARFALDAMPGKQMAIDAELRSGGLDQTEARRRRRLLARESQFYGAMDGAMKFVKGDAIASMVIAVVNILGGLAIGVGQRDMSPAAALSRYGLLTIGEGLVAQIPALLISTAAGILVTRVASEEPDSSLASEISAQIVSQPRALGIAAGLLALFALAPGMPALPFIAISVVLAVGARALVNAAQNRARKAPVIGNRGEAQTAVEKRTAPDEPSEAFRPGVTAVSLEVGVLHAAMVESPEGAVAPLRALVPAMREALFQETGVVFPGVRVRVMTDDPRDQSVTINLQEIPAQSTLIPVGRALALCPSQSFEGRDVIASVHPLSGSPASWVLPAEEATAREQGVEVLSPAEVVAVQLAAVLKAHAGLFLGIQEAQTMLDGLERQCPALVRNVVPKPITVTLLTDVLRRLAEEGVSVKNLRAILETLAQVGVSEKDPVVLSELARSALRREITHRYAPGGRLVPTLLGAEIEDAIREGIQRTASGTFLALDPAVTQDIITAARRSLPTPDAVILTQVDVRRFVRKLIEAEFPRVTVLSYQDLEPGVHVTAAGRITVMAGH